MSYDIFRWEKEGPRVCSVWNCTRSVRMYGECRKHGTRRRYNNDPVFKAKHDFRSRQRQALNGKGIRVGSFIRDLGRSMEEQVEVEKSMGFFQDDHGQGPGTWQRHHIKPLGTFDLTDREQFLEAVHYSNIEPLWFEDHMEAHEKLRIDSGQ